jgi:PKD repeat protein
MRMRFSLRTTVGVLATAALLAGCTQGGEAPVATEAAATPKKEEAAAAAAQPTVQLPDADEILMVWAEAEPDEGTPPLAVQLLADISGGVGQRTVKWDFGDGSPPSSEENPKHTYEKAGTYRASVEVSDTSGDSDSDYVDIEVGEE